MGKQMTIEQKENFISEYPNYTNKELSNLYNRSEDSVSTLGLKLGLKKNQNTLKRIYKMSSIRMTDSNPMRSRQTIDKMRETKIRMFTDGTLKSPFKGKNKHNNEVIKNISLKKRFNHIKEEDIIRLIKEGYNIKKIGNTLGCSSHLISKRMREGKIKMIDYKVRDEEMINRIRELYLGGLSQNKIIKETGYTSWKVSYILEKLGIKRENKNKRKGITKEQIDKMIELYNRNNSITDISKLINLNPEIVFYHLKKNKIPLRNRSDSLKISWEKGGKEKKDKMSKIMREKFLDKDFLEKYKSSINRKPTKPEKIMMDIIEKNNLPFNYVGDGKVWFKGFNPDFLSKNPKHIIEIYGDYWHNLPKDKAKHERRIHAFNSLGYKTLVVWEHELKDEKEVLNKVLEFIK